MKKGESSPQRRRTTVTSKEREHKKYIDIMSSHVSDLVQKAKSDISMPITKELDVGIISASTLDRLIAFLGIDGETPIEQTLNKQRIEHQKTMPMASHHKKQLMGSADSK